MKNKAFSHLHTVLLILLVLSLSFNSCKKGGGGITDSDDPEDPNPSTTEITSSFESEQTSFLPGEIQLIIVEEVVLEDEEYNAELANGAAVTLYLNSEDSENKSLIFVVPEEVSGAHELIFELEEQEQSLEFEIGEYEEIEDPDQLVDDFSKSLTTELEALFQTETDVNIKSFLQEKLNAVNEVMNQVEDLTDEELALVARIIKTNFDYLSLQRPKLKTTSQNVDCSDLKSTIVIQNGIIVTTIASTFLSIDSILLGGGLVSAIIGGVSAGTMAVTIQYRFKNGRIYKEECRQITNYSLFGMVLFKKEGPNDSTVLNHGESQDFLLKTTYDLTDEDKTLFSEIHDVITKISDYLYDEWVTSLLDEEYEETITEDADKYTLANISDSEIEGNISTADTVLSLTFTFQEDSNPTEARDFTFSLTDEDDNSLEVEAMLNPPLPIAYDLQFNTETNETLSDTLKADFAAFFNIESQPSSGTLTLLDENLGVFEYEPDEDYSGDDSFSFSATNSTGDSEVGVVSFAIADDGFSIPKALHGIWENTDENPDDIILLEISGKKIDLYEFSADESDNTSNACTPWIEIKLEDGKVSETYNWSDGTYDKSYSINYEIKENSFEFSQEATDDGRPQTYTQSYSVVNGRLLYDYNFAPDYSGDGDSFYYDRTDSWTDRCQ